jgi:hypothetical protein
LAARRSPGLTGSRRDRPSRANIRGAAAVARMRDAPNQTFGKTKALSRPAQPYK